MRPVNPYHIYGVYDRDSDISKLGFYYAPTYRTMSLQFKRSTGATITAFDLVTESGSVLAQDIAQISSYDVSGGETFYWTGGASLVNPPSHGTLYRPRITFSSGPAYWGHMILADDLFDISYPTLTLVSCTTDSGVSTFSFAVGSRGTTTIEVQVSDDNSSASFTYGSNFSFDTDDFTASSGSFSLTAVVNQTLYSPNGGSRAVSSTYSITFTEADPCGSLSLSIDSQGDAVTNELFELTTSNSVDIQSKGKLFSQGFTEKFWFKGYFAQPEPVIVENYLANGESEEYFQSARVGERKRIDFWPLTDPAFNGLTSAKYHDTASVIVGANTYSLYRIGIEPVSIDNEDRPAGRFLAEFDGAFLQSVMSNYDAA